jgi:hypothetical protein
MASKNRLTVNLSADEASQLASLAKKSKVSKAWLGRHAICAWLERANKSETEPELPLSMIAARKGNT